jgi:hypothetical protein
LFFLKILLEESEMTRARDIKRIMESVMITEQAGESVLKCCGGEWRELSKEDCQGVEKDMSICLTPFLGKETLYCWSKGGEAKLCVAVKGKNVTKANGPKNIPLEKCSGDCQDAYDALCDKLNLSC